MTACTKPLHPATVARHLAAEDVTAYVHDDWATTDDAAAEHGLTVSPSSGRGSVLVTVGRCPSDEALDAAQAALAALEGMDDDYEVSVSAYLGVRLITVSRRCEGHESLRGDAMGASLYCDGTVA